MGYLHYPRLKISGNVNEKDESEVALKSVKL